MSETIDTKRIISGFRPTSDLTVGNYLGAIKPVLDIQNDPSNEQYVFVADLHGLTDHDPREIGPYRDEVVQDCLALGVDPEKTTLYMQSAIEAEVVQIANRTAPYVSVSELARTPNLKEKMQTAVRKGTTDSENSLSANFGLLGYPVLMAADIYAQDAPHVAVGEDQEPHLELARTIANRFNGRFETPILVSPRILAIEAVRVMALDGKGKMSKTNPNQAVILTDDPDDARKKIGRAVTGAAGEWNPILDSHFKLAHALSDEEARAELEEIRAAHMDGKPVMGQFKKAWADSTEKMLVDFQVNKAKISQEDVDDALRHGAMKAKANATRVLQSMKEVMEF